MKKIYCAVCTNGLAYEDREDYHIGEFDDLKAAEKAVIDNLDAIQHEFMVDFDGVKLGAIWIREAEKEDNGLVLKYHKTVARYDYDTKSFKE